jgi:hypothetical protein
MGLLDLLRLQKAEAEERLHAPELPKCANSVSRTWRKSKV